MRATILTDKARKSSSAVSFVATMLLDAGWDLDRIAVGPPGRVSRHNRSRTKIASEFQHTPQPLIDSWNFATSALTHLTEGGITIVGDGDGHAGILSLEMANSREETDRQLWTVAGESNVLRLLYLGRSLATTDSDLESILDWEITQYLSSEKVICRSGIEVELLAELGVESVLVSGLEGEFAPLDGKSTHLYVPGPVSRLGAFPEVLRAVADLPEVSVTFGIEDAEDGYWNGSTWDAFESVRKLLGSRIERSAEIPHGADLVVFGDPFDGCDEIAAVISSRRIAVAARSGSVIAQQWDGVNEWANDEELASIVNGRSAPSRVVRRSGVPAVAQSAVEHGRAREVTIGIPVFGAAEHLGELIDSLAMQSVAPHEILLVADGPISREVAAQIDHWTAKAACAFVVMEQPNRGVCVARNAILEAMSGDSILLVDQDDLLDVRAVELLGEAMRSNPQHAAIACWTEFFGEYNAIEGKPPFDGRVGSRENPIISTAAIVDRNAVGENLRFEPDLAFLYCEDWNFWADLVAEGSTFGLVPKPLVRHRVHTASGGFKRTDLALNVGRDRARRKMH